MNEEDDDSVKVSLKFKNLQSVNFLIRNVNPTDDTIKNLKIYLNDLLNYKLDEKKNHSEQDIVSAKRTIEQLKLQINQFHETYINLLDLCDLYINLIRE